MARINLLPWREELRKERLRQFAVVSVGSAILMGLIVLLVHINIANSIEAQRDRNRFLENEIKEVEKQIAEIKDLEDQKQRLLDRMNIIQRLQRNRPEVVHLFDEIARRVPDGVYLTSLKQNGQEVTITGMAESNARVSALMRNLDASEWLTSPRLDVIKSDGKDEERASSFTVQVKQVSQSGEAADNKGKAR